MPVTVTVQGWIREEDAVWYRFLVETAQDSPKVLRRRFSDFVELEAALNLAFPDVPELPTRIPMASFFDFVLDDRVLKLDSFLRVVTSVVDPNLTSQSLREFLGVSEGLVGQARTNAEGCGMLGGKIFLPAELVSQILSFLTLNERLVEASGISRDFYASAFSVRLCNLSYFTDFVDRKQAGLFKVLCVSASTLERLELRVQYADGRSRLTLPVGVQFPNLRRAKFLTTDECSTNLFSDVLIAAENLIELVFTGPVTSGCVAAIHALDKLETLSLTIVGAGSAEPNRLARWGHGHTRRLKKLEIRKLTKLEQPEIGEFFGFFFPGENSRSSSSSVKVLKWSFLKSDFFEERLLLSFTGLVTLSLSGLRKHCLRVDHILTRILPQLPSTLENLSLGIYEEPDSEWLYRGYVPEPVSALDESWGNLRDLKTLKLVGTALDNEGLFSLARNCRRLTRLCIISHLEFVTDLAVTEIFANLVDLEEFSFLGEIEWLTDNLLLHAASVVPRSKLKFLRFQLTRHMSAIGMDQLAAACDQFGVDFELVAQPPHEIFAHRAEEKLTRFRDCFARTLIL